MALFRCSGSNFKPVEAGYGLGAGTASATALPKTIGPGLGSSVIIGTKGYSTVTIAPTHEVFMGITGIAEDGSTTQVFSSDSSSKTVDVTPYVELYVVCLSTTQFSTTFSIA